MRFYTSQHQFYGGIDFHARSIALCVLDAKGQLALEASLPAQPAAVLDALALSLPKMSYWQAGLPPSADFRR